MLAAVLLSAQATDVGVNKATARLYPVANTPQAIIDLGIDQLKAHIKTIGLYNTKAENLMKTCHILVDQHGGEVPDTRQALEALPGVGRKTANVILNTAFGHPTMAVDTHIFRVSNRTGIAKGKNVVEVEQKLLRHVPKGFLQDAHHWLILHGRYTCIARKPRCGSCIIEDLCEYKEKQRSLSGQVAIFYILRAKLATPMAWYLAVQDALQDRLATDAAAHTALLECRHSDK
ncbi:endonuclease III [Vreelandella sulfidaeris]|uniref:Endonuclease III n=1 Tax=Vreelandella sulfidaeris TaxID=115553 RepID=A0A455UB53_9GAMM|nr:endonuclease III [Halomonas sulfidaeris]